MQRKNRLLAVMAFSVQPRDTWLETEAYISVCYEGSELNKQNKYIEGLTSCVCLGTPI